jgi:hypothetical protein
MRGRPLRAPVHSSSSYAPSSTEFKRWEVRARPSSLSQERGRLMKHIPDIESDTKTNGKTITGIARLGSSARPTLQRTRVAQSADVGYNPRLHG